MGHLSEWANTPRLIVLPVQSDNCESEPGKHSPASETDDPQLILESLNSTDVELSRPNPHRQAVLLLFSKGQNIQGSRNV
jgi:hypothetical protein